MTPVGSTVAWVLLCAVAGAVAAVPMAYVMSREPDALAPALVVGAAVTGRAPQDLDAAAGIAVNGVAGVAAGVLYAAVFLVLAGPIPSIPGIGAVALLPHVLAVTMVTTAVHIGFTNVVLPTVEGSSYAEHATAVSGQWVRALAVFAVAFGIVVPMLSSATG